MIEFGHLSHVGLRRDLNEDTYDANAEKGLWLVADGMGGHEYGEVASALARDAAMESARAGSSLSDAIRYAAHTVAAYSQGRRSALPMGTTIAMAATTADHYEVAWIGDSRAYLWDGQLRQISQDHSLVQEMVAQGAITSDQARSHPRRNVVTQALGVTDPDHLRIGVAQGQWCAGRQLLLCTDGLTEHVPDSRIAQILAREALSAQELVDHLVFCALRGGGSDNITVVLAREV
ncbi:MAG: protein phosphatase [Gammaproteobacteria bacterium HGW-Gammaproteobacteria-4]|jgi:protein phosphatase|nr:MAG: protein phosphatase [Gammaproteobacteria bacterium HGW-Gammaproteobacteria-4]